MSMSKRASNAGVDAQTGFSLQRNTALYLLLEKYHEKFKDKKYFICLEHHDDFLFCFLDDFNNAKLIEAYQSKKKAPERWTLDKMSDLVKKVLATGIALKKDPIGKTADYSHSLYFTSNQTIFLECKISKKNVSIKEDNLHVKYVDLEADIKQRVIDIVDEANLQTELDNLNFFWVDLNRTASKQENQLVGQIESTFKNLIVDHRAAVNSLISLFRNIEQTYNQGGVVKLLDGSKRVSSTEIQKALDVITTRSKAFDEWRRLSDEVANNLGIRHFEREAFEFKFTSAFDNFKVITEAEHQKIRQFVKANYQNCSAITLGQIISELHDKFIREQTTNFVGLDLKAVIYAAYFDSTYTRTPTNV
jgi:hypothetical protein